MKNQQKFEHRAGDPCNNFSYDDLDRLLWAQYGVDDSNEVFTIDDLGNRSNVNLRDTTDVNYVIDNLTNRYSKIGDANITYDAAGNLQTDRLGYTYHYDYENRIVEINDVNGTIAKFTYDALGRRIEVNDVVTAANTQRHYYGSGWQVMCFRDSADNMVGFFYYGNDIDEVIFNSTGLLYVHDHLGSTAAVISSSTGAVLERYEYDAYGNPYILEPNYAPDPDGKSDYGNPYLFTGRRVDYLNGGDLKLQYNRNRYYNYYTGRWTTHDPLGYVDGMNLYEYVGNNPLNYLDPSGEARCARCRDNVRPRRIPAHLLAHPDPNRRFGETSLCKDCYDVDLSVTRGGCEGACRKLKITRCSCIIRGWYFAGRIPRWMKDRGGNTPARHEKKHVRLISGVWRNIMRLANKMRNFPCMCIRRAECFEDAFEDYFVKAQIKSCDAVNYGFDCRVYPENHPETSRVCTNAENANNQAFSLLKQFLRKYISCLFIR